MKENTKYNKYRFAGKILVDEIQPWFDFGTAKPWDDPEIPWVWDNKVNREILTILSDGAKNFDEILRKMHFSPKPLLINKEEYQPNIHYQWEKECLKNHLSNLEWYQLISLKNEMYEINFPFFSTKDIDEVNQHSKILAEQFVKFILKSIEDFNHLFESVTYKTERYNLLIEGIVNELFSFFKKKGLIPDEPIIKIRWVEQLRQENFQDWIKQNF